MEGLNHQPRIFGHLSALADTTRSRLMLVLERHEFTVSELCSVLQLPQSTVSRHLKVLGDEGWVVSRPDGTSRRYRVPAEGLEASALRLWHLVREQVAGLAAAEQDARRVRSVLAQRRSRSREFFSSAAGRWDRLRTELFGQRADLLGLLALVDEGWTVGDLGCGTGQVAESLSPFVKRVVAVDDSDAMLEAARERLRSASNVEVRRGSVEALPIDTAQLDAAVLSLVLHHISEPEHALAEVARVLKPGGRLLIVDMMPHDREEYRHDMGHAWQGFSGEQLVHWLEAAGFGACRYRPLPADPEATGPTLFAAKARKGGIRESGVGIRREAAPPLEPRVPNP